VDAVRVRGLSKHFERTVAVDGVDLVLAPGEVRGLLGPNGAGKTTLLRMLFGLISPDAGSIELLGRPLRELGTSALSGVGGFVEEPCFYPYLSGRENLAALARLDGVPVTPERVEQALERVDLAARAEARAAGYSTGMRQRLGIAAALLRSPRLLLLDEPTSGLDPAGARAVAELVRELAADGVAVLLSSHQIGELERVCTSYTFIGNGRTLWEGTAAELQTQAPAPAYALETTDDRQALAIAAAQERLGAVPAAGGGLTVTAQRSDVDRFVLALGDARVVVRRLELRVSPLESMFFALTGERPIVGDAPVEFDEQVPTAV
jgi:ABC-2 type transport system ATP-binding protein